MRKAATAVIEDNAIKETTEKGILTSLKLGFMSIEQIAQTFEVSVEFVLKMKNEIKT